MLLMIDWFSIKPNKAHCYFKKPKKVRDIFYFHHFKKVPMYQIFMY